MNLLFSFGTHFNIFPSEITGYHNFILGKQKYLKILYSIWKKNPLCNQSNIKALNILLSDFRIIAELFPKVNDGIKDRELMTLQ